MSRVVQFAKTGKPEVLEIIDISVPEPGPQEVRIRVKALGLNRAESMFRSGQYLEQPKLPARLGYEASGIVDAVGSGVTHVNVGDAVSTVPNFSLNSYGLYGELVNAPAASVVLNPPGLNFEESASIWMMYLTAYDGIISVAGLKKGDFILIPAASSSVGIAAIQLANMIGAIPIALTRTSAKRDQLLKAGAAHVIATSEQDIVAEVKTITKNKGAQVAFDPVGGPTFDKLLQALAPGGKAIIYGALSKEPTTISALDVIGKMPIITGSIILTTSGDPEKLKVAVKYVNDGLKSGALKPVIAKTFKFDDIVESHHYLESNEQFGKIVVTV